MASFFLFFISFCFLLSISLFCLVFPTKKSETPLCAIIRNVLSPFLSLCVCTGRDVDMRLSTPSRPATSTSLSSVHQVVTTTTTTSSSNLSDRGATSPPLHSAVSPSLSTSSAVSDRTSFSSRPAATSQRDLDEELRVLEESSKLTQNNINMILKQAEDQLKAEEITWEQYNNVLSQVRISYIRFIVESCYFLSLLINTTNRLTHETANAIICVNQLLRTKPERRRRRCCD